MTFFSLCAVKLISRNEFIFDNGGKRDELMMILVNNEFVLCRNSIECVYLKKILRYFITYSN